MKRNVLAYCGLALCTLTLAACGDQSSSVEGKTANKDLNATQPLTVVSQWEINSLDPSKVGYVLQSLQVGENLVTVNPQGQLVGQLATSWTSSSDNKVWQVKLRPNVSFHNGEALNAATVKKALAVALTKPTLFKNVNLTDINVVDDLTLEFNLAKSLASFPAYLAHATLIILAPQSYDNNNAITQVIATGPYKVANIEPPQKIQLQAYSNYWGEKAKIQQITYIANSRSETRTLMAQSDKHTLVYNLDYASTARLNKDPQVVVKSVPITRTIQLKVNNNAPHLANPEFRQILSAAVDRTALSEQLLGVPKGQAYQLLPPAYKDWYFVTNDQLKLKPDYNKLQKKLAALGYTYDQATNSLSKDSKAVEFTLRTFPDRAELPLIATALQDQFKQLGIKLNVAIGNSSEIAAGHQDGSLELALYSRNYGLLPDPTGILREDYKVGGSDWGAMNWSDSVKFQSLLEKYTATNDATALPPLRKEIMLMLQEQMPMIPLVYSMLNVAHSHELLGLELDPFEKVFYLNKLSWKTE